MAASKRCIFLTGAPDLEDLRWDEQHLRNDFTLPIRRFLKDGSSSNGDFLTQATPPPTYTKWRRLPVGRNGHADVEPTQFLSFDGHRTVEQEHDFLEQSIVILDGIDPVNIVPGTNVHNDYEDQGLETTFLSDPSFTSTSFSSVSAGANGSFFIPHVEHTDISCPTTDLKRIPNSDYITRIRPQTMTVNLLVGIISISSSRTVRLRRRDAEMDIIDMTVGDETRAGFSISFWLAPLESQRKPADDLRKTLANLRTGNVVLLKNVALASWRGCVFGQSLSRKFAKNSTSIAVLGDAASGTKAERVRAWTCDFVGVAPRSTSARPESEDGPALPPDTQD